jgi:hypothetical protein
VTNVTFVQGDITSLTSYEGANLLIDQVSFTAHALRAHQKPLL